MGVVLFLEQIYIFSLYKHRDEFLWLAKSLTYPLEWPKNKQDIFSHVVSDISIIIFNYLFKLLRNMTNIGQIISNKITERHGILLIQ